MGENKSNIVDELLNLHTDHNFKRCERYSLQFQSTENYRTLTESLQEKYTRIKNILPDELKPILDEYDNDFGSLITEVQSYFYRQGFSDSMHFVIGILGNKLIPCCIKYNCCCALRRNRVKNTPIKDIRRVRQAVMRLVA